MSESITFGSVHQKRSARAQPLRHARASCRESRCQAEKEIGGAKRRLYQSPWPIRIHVGVLVSRPGESHPEPLAERNVTFSRHSAPIRHVRRMWSGTSAQTSAAFF